LVYVTGCCPGRAGGVVFIKDSIKMRDYNRDNNMLNYPTFIPLEGK